jgi:hypothetical protein
MKTPPSCSQIFHILIYYELSLFLIQTMHESHLKYISNVTYCFKLKGIINPSVVSGSSVYGVSSFSKPLVFMYSSTHPNENGRISQFPRLLLETRLLLSSFLDKKNVLSQQHKFEEFLIILFGFQG